MANEAGAESTPVVAVALSRWAIFRLFETTAPSRILSYCDSYRPTKGIHSV